MRDKEFRQAGIFLLTTVGLSFFVFWGPIAVLKVPTANFVTGAMGPIWAIILFIIGGFIPSLNGILLTAVYEGREGVRSLLRSSVQVKMGRKSYILSLAIAAYFALTLILIDTAQGHAFDYSQFWLQLPSLLPLIILGPFSEELGWRGFALKRLLKSANPITASLLVGLAWSLWHLPLFYIVGGSQYELGIPFLPFLITVTSSSFAYTYLFILNRYSVFSAVFLHWVYTYTIQVISTGITRTDLYNWLEFVPALVLGCIFAFLLTRAEKDIRDKLPA